MLGRDAWVALLPANHPLGRRASESGVTLKELADQPFILATGGCAVNGQSLIEQAGLHLSDVRVTIRDWASACVLVREGIGVTLVPESTLPNEQHGLRVMPLVPAIQREFGLISSHIGKTSPATQALLEWLRKDGISPLT